MSPDYFPPEYRIEVGEVCGRGGCRSRMVYAEAECRPDCEEDDCLNSHEDEVFCPAGCWSGNG